MTWTGMNESDAMNLMARQTAKLRRGCKNYAEGIGRHGQDPKERLSGKIAPLTPVSRMNKTEAKYSQELDAMLFSRQILGYHFGRVKFGLADRTWYTPDFIVVYPTHIEVVEIKGFLRDDAAAKFKIAAETFPWFKWKMLRLRKGEWGIVMEK